MQPEGFVGLESDISNVCVIVWKLVIIAMRFLALLPPLSFPLETTFKCHFGRTTYGPAFMSLPSL